MQVNDRMVPADAVRRATQGLVGDAVHQNSVLSIEGLRERMFSRAFSNMVYPQIWEDPRIDLEALDLSATSRIVTIASGGCNVMSYLTAGPAAITAVDLNETHLALTALKLTAARYLPDHRTFVRFFADANSAENVTAYDHHLRWRLEPAVRAYWDSRDVLGRRRITEFTRGFYRYGLLGKFIGLAHALARVLGANPKAILAARSKDEQRAIYVRELQPLFRNVLVRWVAGNPSSLYGLGIPPAQYKKLAADHPDGIIEVLRQRVERLACDFDLKDNYFAWQAFGRGYGSGDDRSLPPYLEVSAFAEVKTGTPKVALRHMSFTDFLRGQPDGSLDRFVLLDAQDWMDDETLNDLWREITRTANAGARVIFRTAASPSLLPGRVSEAVLDRWDYREKESQAWPDGDRSAIYGGFHLYVLRQVG